MTICRMTGQTVSGNYIFREGSSGYSVYYCDFSKLISDTEFQKRLGTVRLSDNAMFHAVKTVSTDKPHYAPRSYSQRRGYSTTAAPNLAEGYIYNSGQISFTNVVINYGEGMALNGTFKAPQPGNYMFIISGTSYYTNVKLSLKHAKRDGSVMSYSVYDIMSTRSRTLTKTFVLTLDANDEITVWNDVDLQKSIQVAADTPFSFSGYRVPT